MLLAAIMLTSCSSSTTSGVDANITEEKTEEKPEKTTDPPASETITEAETEEAEGTVTNTEAEETEEKETTTAKETTAKETTVKETMAKETSKSETTKAAEMEAKAEVPETTKAAAQPTTAAPTTAAPTTAAPTTAATIAPTTVAPTTVAPTTVAPTTAAPVYENTYGKYSFKQATDDIIANLEYESGHDMKLDATLTKLAQAWADYLRAEHAGSPIHSTSYGQCEYVAYIPQVYPGHAEQVFRTEESAIGGYVACGITGHVSQFKTDPTVTNIGVGISRSADGMFGYEDIYVVVIGVSDDDMDDIEFVYELENPEAVPYLSSPSENLSSANYN
jgi:hypothetical protein